MKQTALQDYTKQKKLYGLNQQHILDKFVLYASLCSDPMNIYKYMEEKSICIYLANYWTNRATLFADMGDFKDALICLKEAKLRDHIVSENQIKIEDFIERIKKKMIIAMKRIPPKIKRSANEYDFLYESQRKTTIQSLEIIAQIFEKNYKEAKKQVQKQFELKMHGKNKSWLAPIQEQNQEKIRKISQKMKSMNNYEFNSMTVNTPISKKDPMRLTKTMDSVEMLKKKKSTHQKQNKKQKLTQNSCHNQNGAEKAIKFEQLSDQMEQDEPKFINTTPVGKQMSMLSRRVTFNTKNKKIEEIQKLRGEQVRKDNPNCNQTIVKQEPMQRSKSFSKRGSILKNKKILQHMDIEDDEK